MLIRQEDRKEEDFEVDVIYLKCLELWRDKENTTNTYIVFYEKGEPQRVFITNDVYNSIKKLLPYRHTQENFETKTIGNITVGGYNTDAYWHGNNWGNWNITYNTDAYF